MAFEFVNYSNLLTIAENLNLVFIRLFDDVLNRDRNVKKQDIFPIINQISKNPSGRHTSWYFYRHYWDTLVFT